MTLQNPSQNAAQNGVDGSNRAFQQGALRSHAHHGKPTIGQKIETATLLAPAVGFSGVVQLTGTALHTGISASQTLGSLALPAINKSVLRASVPLPALENVVAKLTKGLASIVTAGKLPV